MHIGLPTFGPCTVHWTRGWQLLVSASVVLESCLTVSPLRLSTGAAR